MSTNLTVGAAISKEDLTTLESELRGSVVRPSDSDFDDRRSVWNGAIDNYPLLIVQCQGAVDVLNALAFATEHELPFSIRGGAHHQTGVAIAEDGIVLDLSSMNHVRVDPDEQLAQVGPGCRARDVLKETQHYGLAPPTGSAGDVGVAGSTLGGAIGWMRRKNGLGIDALRSVDIVTPAGELITASPEENEELFWAVRGGGGNFGIVTNFEFELYEVGPIVAGLGVFYPAENAPALLTEYREAAAEAPDEVTTMALKTHVPDLPPMPDALVGEEAVAILGSYIGETEAGMDALQPFREFTDPLIDMSDPMPYLLLHQLGTMMFPSGRKYSHRSCFVDELSDDTISAVVDQMETAPSALSAIGIWQLGGKIAAVGSDETAYPHRQAAYMITVESNWESGDDDANIQWARGGDERFRELGGYGAYAGFTGVSPRDSEPVRERVYGRNYDRLLEIKTTYDEQNILNKNVNLDPSSE